MKTELLIVSNEQYGYHIDSYKYCQYLKDKYDITYICFNKGLKEIPFDKISVKYIPWKGSWIFRSCRFIITVLKMILTMSSSGLVFIVYFNGFTIFKYLLPIRRYILDVRTLSVSKGKYKRLLEDYFLKLSIRFYRYKTCISEGVVDKLGLKNDSGTYILPLGADILSDVEKDFSSMRLLYVGTLTGRNILLTLKGFHRYWLSAKTVNLSYDIIGEGEEYDLLQDYIVQNNLSAIVRLHGYIHQSELKRFYDSCNIGISFVPITSYYDHQPSTKTFEYILSGLYTIATATTANKEVLTEKNGVLIADSEDAFFFALKKIEEIRFGFRSAAIRDTLISYKWSNIVRSKLEPILNLAVK